MLNNVMDGVMEKAFYKKAQGSKLDIEGIKDVPAGKPRRKLKRYLRKVLTRLLNKRFKNDF